ncbi:MAG: 1-acyl-sn-glycerol-3-phosphate acyltransferase [Micromonosporaceae bacterium]
MRVPPAPVRRAITIPALVVLTAVGAAVLTVVVVVTGPVSLCLRGRWRAVRLACFFVTYLALEIAALARALTVWARHVPAFRGDASRYHDVNFRLIEEFLARLYGAARRLFGLRVEVVASQQAIREAAPAALSRPAIVLSRHAGPGDSFLLVYALLAYAGRRPFVVLKHTLAFDPWIDVLLGRVPHRFIRPDGANDGAAQAIRDLATHLSERDALVIFPEGGNFTADRRRGAIRRLWRRGQRGRARQAARLGHVLPPRPAGARCAMDAVPDADLIVVAHTGLDHLDSATAVWRGIPLERPLRVTWWRVPASDVPTSQDGRTDWLYDQWARVDAWIASYADGGFHDRGP